MCVLHMKLIFPPIYINRADVLETDEACLWSQTTTHRRYTLKIQQRRFPAQTYHMRHMPRQRRCTMLFIPEALLPHMMSCVFFSFFSFFILRRMEKKKTVKLTKLPSIFTHTSCVNSPRLHSKSSGSWSVLRLPAVAIARAVPTAIARAVPSGGPHHVLHPQTDV